MSLSQKIGVSFVFLLGSLTTGASIARTVVQYEVVQECGSQLIILQQGSTMLTC
jgi:hypothetical protein